MQKNQIVTMTCEGLGASMEGVGRVDGMAVFVPGLLPGETASVRIVKTQPRYAFGRLEGAVREPSPERREPDCPAYPRCGGCSCRHMTYGATLEAKRQHVEDCFRRIGHLEVEVPPVLGLAQPTRYRNKTALPVGGTADRPVLGFYAERSHTVIPIDSCPNAMPPADELQRAFLTWAKHYHLRPYDEVSHSGLLRHLVIRVTRRGEAMAVVVANGDRVPHEDALVTMLRQAGAVSVILNTNTARTNVILGPGYRTLFGPDTVSDELCGLTFEVGPASFFQVDPEQTEVLYQTALAFAELKGEERLCDVYCGAGTITLMMARHCREALGIEIVPQAIENAKANAVRNGVGNASFRCGAAEELLPRLVEEGLRPDVIVVDPPRKGLEPAVIDAIAQAAPRRVVYVSCDVATQARDAALLCAKGYRVDRLQPVDMFCWASGVETVCLLSKIRSAPHIDIDLDMTELDVTKAETKATYEEIKAYVVEHTGLKVSHLYIAQVKAKHGIIERDCYNKPKTEANHVPQCPPEKEKAIEDALRYFQMITD